MVAIAGLQVSGIPMMTMMGWASAIMVPVTMLAAVTLLPALLGIVRHARQQPAGARSSSSGRPTTRESKSARWAARVVAKPVRYGAVAAVVLGVLAIPVFSMRLGFADAGNDAPGTTTRKAYDLMADGYGAGVNGPLDGRRRDRAARRRRAAVIDRA